MKRRLNCWIVAMHLWWLSRGKGYSIVTRSHSFHGKIPHFLYGVITGRGRVRVIEYIPPKNQRWRTDFVFCFPGSYRVWDLKVTGVHRCATEEQALTGIFGHFGDRRDKQ